MSRKPIRVFYGRLSGRFYATQHYRETPKDGYSVFEVTGEKDDVTDDLAFIAREHDTSVFDELAEREEEPQP